MIERPRAGIEGCSSYGAHVFAFSRVPGTGVGNICTSWHSANEKRITKHDKGGATHVRRETRVEERGERDEQEKKGNNYENSLGHQNSQS